MSRIESYSSLSTLATCAQKYAYSYGMQIQPPGANVSQHMGTVIHEGLKQLYVDGWTPEKLPKALEAAEEAWGDFRLPFGTKKPWLTLDFALRRLEMYVDERVKNPTVLEESPIIMDFVEEMHVFDWMDSAGRLVRVKGIPDFVVREGRKLRVVDNKTTSGWVNSHYAMQFRVGNQLRLYAAMVQNLFGMEVAGGLINVVYVGEKALDGVEKWADRKSSPSLLIPIDFTQEQIEETHEWVRGLQIVRDICAFEGVWPKNERACNDYGGCEFLSLCSAPTKAARMARITTQFVRKEER